MAHALSLSPTDSDVNRTVSILERLFPAPRAFTIRLWNGTELPASSRSAFGLTLNHPGALRRMFTPPIELALGEAFIYGDFDIDGDIFSAFTLFDVIFNRSISAGEVVALARENPGASRFWPNPTTRARPVAPAGCAPLARTRSRRDSISLQRRQ